MKSIFSLIIIGLVASSWSNAQTKAETEARINSVGDKTKVEQFKQPAFSKAMRGGGIVSTDCYSFVPIPDDAIALDQFNFTNNDGGLGLDGWWGPFDIDFEFCHFGVDYDEIYISAKGLISFGAGTTTFIPTAFPNNNINMVAGFGLM